MFSYFTPHSKLIKIGKERCILSFETNKIPELQTRALLKI